MKKLKVLVGVALLIHLCSCSARDNESPHNNFSDELKADPVFDWSTTQRVTIEVTGLELPVEISRKLILSTDEGDVFYAGTQKMNDNFQLSVELPNHIQEVTLKYGAIEKTGAVDGSMLSFDYLSGEEDN